MESGNPPSVSDAMDRLWAQFLPQMTERVAVLEAASAALADGGLNSALREQATSAAHKLAGVLGTFGLADGTELARKAETAFSGEPCADAALAAQLSQIAAQLRAMVTARK